MSTIWTTDYNEPNGRILPFRNDFAPPRALTMLEEARVIIESSVAHARAVAEGRSRRVEADAGLPLLDGRTISNVSVLENDSKDVGAFSVLGSIGKEQLPAGHNVASTDFNSLQCPVNQDSQITRASGRQGTKDLKSPPEQIDTDAKFGNCANRAGRQVSSRINRCVATPVVSAPTFQSAVPLDFTHSHKGQLTTLAGTSNGSPNGRSAHNRIIPLLREKEQEFVQLIPRTDEDDSSDADGFLPAERTDAANEAAASAIVPRITGEISEPWLRAVVTPPLMDSRERAESDSTNGRMHKLIGDE